MASTRTRVDIAGIENIRRNFQAIKTELFNDLGAAALAGAEIVADDARNRARRKSGALASGIKAAVTWDKRAPVAFAGAGMDAAMNDVFVKIGANGQRYYYPSSIEYGHPGAPAYPFMRPAMDASKAKVRKEIRQRIMQVIARYGQ